MMLGLIFLTLVSLTISAEHCPEKSDDCSNVTGSINQSFDEEVDWEKATSVYQFHAKDIHGNDVSLDKYRGHVLIVVNVASDCRLTDTNYKQLVELHKKYKDSKGLRILAFPSNQFLNQEPGTSAQILDFVKRYNVEFDMFEKIDVNGEGAHPLWKWLKEQKNGSGYIANGIKWNFTKFVIDKNGQVVKRFAPTDEPLSMETDLLTHF